jgi:hypothetical protein
MSEMDQRKLQQETHQQMVYSLVRVLKLQLGQADGPSSEMKNDAMMAIKSGVVLNKEHMDVISQILEEGDLEKCAQDIRSWILQTNQCAVVVENTY